MTGFQAWDAQADATMAVGAVCNRRGQTIRPNEILSRNRGEFPARKRDPIRPTRFPSAS